MTLFASRDNVLAAAAAMGLPQNEWRQVPEDRMYRAFWAGLEENFADGMAVAREGATVTKQTGQSRIIPLDMFGNEKTSDDILRLVGAAHCNAVMRQELGVSLALLRPGLLWIGPEGTEPPRMCMPAATLAQGYPNGWAYLQAKARAVHAAGTPQRFDVDPDNEAPLVAELIALMAYTDHRAVIEEETDTIILWAHCCGVWIGTKQAPPRIDIVEQMALQIDQGMAC